MPNREFAQRNAALLKQIIDVTSATAKWAEQHRSEVARAHNLPAYVIFHDATLEAIAHRAPQSLGELQDISGIGAKKLAAYGEEVLRVVASDA